MNFCQLGVTAPHRHGLGLEPCVSCRPRVLERREHLAPFVSRGTRIKTSSRGSGDGRPTWAHWGCLGRSQGIARGEGKRVIPVTTDGLEELPGFQMGTLSQGMVLVIHGQPFRCACKLSDWQLMAFSWRASVCGDKAALRSRGLS